MNASLCRHLKTNGAQCRSRAVADAKYCRAHEQLHEGNQITHMSASAPESPATSIIKLEVIEDSASVQRALSVVITAVAAGTLDAARARVLLYGLQIASANARRLVTAPKAEVLAPKAEGTGDSAIVDARSALPDRCPDELAVEVKEREIEPSDAHVDAVQAVEEDRETKHLDPSDAIGTEGSDADFAEETLPPATAHATDNPVAIAPTYEMEARSRLLAIRRLRDEPANSLLTQRECVSGIFRDE